MADGVGTGETFGALLRRWRQQAALSQEELAERARLSVDAVGTLERGRRTLPRPDTVALLAKALGLAPEERAALAAAARPLPAPAAAGARPSAAAASIASPRSLLDPAPLPMALTSFIGRERELAALRERLLEPRTRLLTLIGPGGSGKTRLAAEAARAAEAAFADGAAFVALAAVTAPALVLPTIMQALGLRETGGRAPQEALRAALAGKQLLLLLDNCEQVAAAAPEVAGLVAAVPGLRVLATSRARLAVAGERVHPVDPLQVPSAAEARDLEVLGRIEAVRLFVERAQDVLPGFALNGGNAAAVAAICARLDGLPLAIELAAAWSRHLPPATLLKRLEASQALVAGGSRDLPPRQQTLQATIAWSYALLDADARALFRRLSVFVGGWTVEAAAAVCAAPGGLPEQGEELLLGLSALADQSLVVVAEGPEGEPRFRLLETVRAFGRERLGEAGELEGLAAAHAAYFLSLADEAREALAGPAQAQWFHRLEAELPNLRAALAWALDRADTERALRAATALSVFWYARAHFGEGRGWLARGLAMEGTATAGTRARALDGAAWLGMFQGDCAGSERMLEEALGHFRQVGDVNGAASAVGHLGSVASMWLRDDIPLPPLVAEAGSLLAEVTDRQTFAYLHMFLGEAAQCRGDFDEADGWYAQALALYREMGNALFICIILIHQGLVALARGAYAQAAAVLRENLHWAQEAQDIVAYYFSFFGLAYVAAADGQFARAARLWGVCEAVGETRGMELLGLERSQLQYDEWLASTRAALGAAAFVDAWEQGRALSLEQATAEALLQEEPYGPATPGPRDAGQGSKADARA